MLFVLTLYTASLSYKLSSLFSLLLSSFFSNMVDDDVFLFVFFIVININDRQQQEY